MQLHGLAQLLNGAVLFDCQIKSHLSACLKSSFNAVLGFQRLFLTVFFSAAVTTPIFRRLLECRD